MDRRRAAGGLLVLAACVVYATAAPTAGNHTSLDLYDGTPDGCYYNFQHYREGDRIMTNEPCLNCTCHNRMLMCYLRVCPFTKPIGQDCTIEKRADQCCPIVTCPDVDLLTSTTTSPAEYGATGLGHADKYGCSINGKYFSEGSKVPPMPNKPCEHCYCIRNMTTCVMQECTLHVDGCTPIYHKDVCCPVRYSCDHPEDEMPLLDDLSTTVRPTPGFLLTTTTLAPVTQMTQDCLYENKIIPDGALIKTEKACDHCYCMKGDIVCVVQECGTPMENEGKNCTAIAPREGVCCPDTYICEGDEPTTETYDGPSYTTVSELLTTKVPPRRVESEGSGYRNEPDDILKTESPTLVSEFEGSGDEDSVTEALPVSHEPSLETDTATKTPIEFLDLTTEGGEHKDVSENSPSTTSSSIVQSDELLTTKAQDEEIGSGEEHITTEKIVPMTSDISTIEDQSTSEPSLITTKASEDESSGEKSTKAPILHEDQTIISTIVTKEDEITKSTVAIEDAPTTEQISVKTTPSIPTSDENNGLTTDIQDDKEDKPEITQKPEFLSTTGAPGIEDDFVTTESQGLTEDHEVPGAELEPHHEITMTASTPLLEEIEKDSIEQQKEVDEDITDIYKTTTTIANVPVMTIADHDNKPDLLDETIATNIPTTISTLENDESDITTAEPQTEEDIETGSNLEDESKKTSPSDYITLEPQTTQHTLINESSEPETYVPITTASVSDDESQKTTLSSSITTSAPPKSEEEKSEFLTTSSPTTSADIEIKKTTLLESHTLETETGNEANIEQTSEPQQPSTTSDLLIDGEERVTSPATISTSSESEFAHDVTEESPESQKYTPTTISFISQEESKKTTQPAIDTQSSEVTDLGDRESVTEESSESQHYSPTTTSSLIEEERKKTTTKDVSGDTEYQQNEITTIEPDKGLNTIPSGSIEEETTEAEKYTQPSETFTTVSSAELQNKFDGVTEASIASSKQTTPTPVIPLESTDEENVGGMAHDIVEQTSLPAVVTEEVITSTESPIIEFQETGTSSVPLATETMDQTSDSKEPKETKTYESSTQALQTESSITDKHETSSPSYPIIPESTTTNLEENEIVNEPRIPGEGDCLFNGVTYRNESAVPSTNKCQSGCRCISSIIKCDPIICSAPPEYMDNCQTVYDSLDSCCPTYVCDHKTETMPPQSHSQMSGTEAPVAPVKCNGDECVLSDDKKQPEDIPPVCDSGDCISQVVTSPQPSIIPEQPVDHHGECKGEKCVPPGPSNQMCNEDSGCQASPVKPCVGSECEITSPTTIAPQKLEPCADGLCKVEVGTPENKPHDGYIEKECTEKSCKRKGDSETDQLISEKCSGLECQPHESKPAMELTTEASITLPPKDSEQEAQTKSTDLANVTEKGDISESPDADSATKPTADTTDETIDGSSQTKTSPIAEGITTQLPNLHEKPEETSTQRESATPSENDNYATKSTLLPEAETNKPLSLPDEQKPEKQDDVTTETGNIASSEITTTLPRETENYSTLIDTQNKSTEKPEKDVFEDRATSVSVDVITEQPKTHDKESSDSPNIKPTDVAITIPTHDRETSEQSTIQPIIVSTTPLEETYDSGLQQTTQSPMYTQYEETTASLVSKTEEITKSPQESDENDVTKKVIEEIDSTLDSDDVTKSPESTYSAETTSSEAGKLGPESPKPENNQQYITTASEDSLSEETTPISSDDSGVQEVTKLSEKIDLDDITPNPLEELTTKTPISIDLGEKDSTLLPGTESDVALDVTTHSGTDIKQTTTSSVEQDVETTKTRTELPEVTEPSKAIESDSTKQSDVTESSNFVDFDEEKATKTPETIIAEITTLQQESGMEATSIKTIEETGTESFKSTYSPHEPDNESITTIIEETSKSDDSKSQGVTQPPVPESVPPQDTTVTIVSINDEHKTTFDPYSQEKSTIIIDTVSDNITPSILPNSKNTEPTVTSFNEITTIAYDHSQPTEHATLSSTNYIDEITLSSSISPLHEEQDLITISQKEITDTPLNLVTESEQITDVPASETELDKTDITVSKPPKESSDTKTPVYELETTATESFGDSDKTTQKPEPTRIIDLGEDKTETPLIQESEKDTMPEIATKPNDATTISYPKETSDETLDITTKPVPQDMTTEPPTNEPETKIPDGFTVIPTNKPIIREGEPTEPERDEFETEAPYVNKLSTYLPVDFSTEKATKETATTQAADSTEHALPEEEIPSTRVPSYSPSETVSTEFINTMDAKLTTLVSEQTTELSKVQTPTELSVSSDEDAKLTTLAAEQTTELSKIQTPTELTVSSHETEIPTKVLESEPSESPTSPTDMSENKEPETATEISGIPELTTQEADKGTNTEYSSDKITTEDTNALEKEKVHEVATESSDQISHEPSQPTVTETLDTDERGTTIAPYQDSDDILLVTNATKTPESIQTSTPFSEMTTIKPDIEKSPVSTSNHEYPETSTTINILEEKTTPVDVTETPMIISDQHTVNHATEAQPALTETATKPHESATELVEDDLVTGKPTLQETTSYSIEVTQKSTSSPVPVEIITEADQSLTSIDPHVEQLATTDISDIDRTSTPIVPEIEVQTETVTPSSERPLLVSSTEISAHDEKIPTTAKAEDITTSPLFEKLTTPVHKPTELAATEQPKPVPTEQPTDEMISPDDEPPMTSGGSSGYGTDPDYMEEDQTFGPGTCRYGGKVYVSAQQIPRDDPCDFCFCFRSDIICLQQSCPPPIHGCHEEPISGFCCPRYECPVSMATTVNVTTTTTTTTTTLPPHFPVHSYKGSAQKRGCLIKGHTYKVGEVVRASSGPCLHCTCGGDGQMKCDPKQCTPEPMLRQMIAAAVSAKRRR